MAVFAYIQDADTRKLKFMRAKVCAGAITRMVAVISRFPQDLVPGWGYGYAGAFLSRAYQVQSENILSLHKLLMLKIQLIKSLFPPMFLHYTSSFRFSRKKTMQAHHVVLWG